MDTQSALNAYNTAQQATQAAQANLQNFQGSQKSAMDFYNDAQNKYGVQDAANQVAQNRQAVSNVQQLLNNLPGAVNQQTRGQMVSEGQRQGLLQNEQAPLQTQYNTANNAYGNAQNSWQNALTQANNMANMGYQGQLNQFNQLNSIYGNALQNQDQQRQNYQFWQNYNQQVLQNNAMRALYAAQAEATRQSAAQTAQQIGMMQKYLDAAQARVNGASTNTPSLASIFGSGQLNPSSVNMSAGQNAADNSLDNAMRTIQQAQGFKYGKLATPQGRSAFLASL